MVTLVDQLIHRDKFSMGTAAQWANSDIIPQAGWMCYEHDTRRFKIGDGTKEYTELDYSPIGLDASVIMTAHGAVSAGDVVALRLSGIADRVTATNSNIARWFGIAANSAVHGAQFTVTVFGGINSNNAGLTAGALYYLEPTGALTTTQTSNFVGRAVTDS